MGAPSAAAQVLGPTMPSGVSPCALCHARVAACVCGPNLPSAGTPTIFCHATTSAPLEPSPICACVVDAGAEGIDMVIGVVPGITPGMGTPGAAEGTPASVASAFCHVTGPTMPSAATPCAACQVLVAASVFGPKMPSALTPTQVCQSATSGPSA